MRLLALSRSDPAWLSEADFRRLLPVCCPGWTSARGLQPPTPSFQAASSMFWAHRPASNGTGPFAADDERNDERRAADVVRLEHRLREPLLRLARHEHEMPRLSVATATREAARVEDPPHDLVGIGLPSYDLTSRLDAMARNVSMRPL
jgi:hypothetical protein